MKFELWHLWSYRSWWGPCKGSFTPRDKAKAGMTWIFNFYLPIFCRKNILGVWKEAHGFLSHYSGCALSYQCEGGVSVCYNLGQMWELFFSWRVPKTRHGACKHFTEGHSSLHGGSSLLVGSWVVLLGLWCVTEAFCHKQKQRQHIL